MDFARKQLEKYGWSDGKGLGKWENGIAQALKPKLKRSVTGVGHDAAADFTEHWWTQLYNKAAGNVEVEEKDGKTKKIKTKDADEFEITNSTWKLTRKRKKDDNKEKYADFFVKKAVLANGGRKMEDVSGSESDEEENEKKDVFKMTDEELFAACEGRTAHKGARHGLKATGKLARIAQQEQMLLIQPQFEGYSHAKKLKKTKQISNDEQNIDEEKVCSDSSNSNTKKQKKKQSRLKSGSNIEDAESMIPLPERHEKDNSESVTSDNEKEECSRKSKHLDTETADGDKNNQDKISKKKKKKLESKTSDTDQNEMVVENTDDHEIALSVKKSKKKKLKGNDT